MSPGLMFLHCGRFPRCTAVIDKHFRDYYTLQFMASGRVELAYDDERHDLSGRWFWPGFPGPRIRFRPGGSRGHWSHRYVAARGPRVSQWFADGLWPRQPQPAPAGPGIVRLYDELLTLARRTDAWDVSRAANRLERILIDLAEARSRPLPAEPWLTQILECLDRHARSATDPAYAAIAREAGLGLSTLRRKFRDRTGTPIHQYVLQAKIQHAREWLSDSDCPVKTIAGRLGYRDVYFFTRQFKALTGVAPAVYRRSRQR